MRFSEGVAQGIQNLDEHWDGGGQPLGLTRRGDPGLCAHRAAGAGDRRVPDRATASRPRSARSRAAPAAGSIRSWRRRSSASPRGPASGRRCARTACSRRSSRSSRRSAARSVDEDYLDDIAAAFAQVIDSKSPYTSGHSERVTLFTDLIAEQMGFAAERRRWLKRAALLHDIGKLGVSNSILDKPGKLDADEWAAMKQHAALHRDDPVAHRGVRRSCGALPARITSGSTARAIRAGLQGDADRARNAHHHDRRHLRRADRRAALSRRHAGLARRSAS